MDSKQKTSTSSEPSGAAKRKRKREREEREAASLKNVPLISSFFTKKVAGGGK